MLVSVILVSRLYTFDDQPAVLVSQDNEYRRGLEEDRRRAEEMQEERRIRVCRGIKFKNKSNDSIDPATVGSFYVGRSGVFTP